VPAIPLATPPPGIPAGCSRLQQVKKVTCSTAGRPRTTVYQSTRPSGMRASSAVA